MFTITHCDCEGSCDAIAGRPNVCGKCLSLTKVIRKCAVRCYLKRFASQLLFAKLFQEPAALDELVNKTKADFLYERYSAQFDKLLKLETYELQSWVKSSFLSIRKDRRNPILSHFMTTVVEPTLSVNVVSAAAQKSTHLRAQACFERYLHHPQTDEYEQVNLAIAEASLNGRLQGHPFIMGLILSSLRVLEREEKGITGAGRTQGRIAKSSAMSSDAAKDLAMEAARMLCRTGGNHQLLASLGCHTRPFKDEQYTLALQKLSLPVPFLALADDAVLRSNLEAIDRRHSAFSGRTGCNWTGHVDL